MTLTKEETLSLMSRPEEINLIFGDLEFIYILGPKENKDNFCIKGLFD